MSRKWCLCIDCREIIDWTEDRMCSWCRMRFERELAKGTHWALSRACRLARQRHRQPFAPGVQLTFHFRALRRR